MQNVGQTFRDILASGNYESEIKVCIEGLDHNMVEYRENSLLDVSIARGLFNGDNLSIGAACVASCQVVLSVDGMTGKQLSQTIPKGARIEIYERINGETPNYDTTSIIGTAVAGVAVVSQAAVWNDTNSEWLLQGVFFVDERDDTSWTTRLSLSGIDRMALADDYYPGTSDGWPAQGKIDTEIVQTIASTIGVSVDNIGALAAGYMIPFPGTYTMREVLSYIGAMYCANWIITADGKLRIMKLNELPSETNDLINQINESITITSADRHIYVRSGGIWIEPAG